MSCSWRLALLLGVLPLATGVSPRRAASQAPSAIPGDPGHGQRIFVERRCVRCHAIWGIGGTLGPDFATVGAGRSLQQLAGMFWNHTPRMIETVRERGFDWPTFTEDELADIISYVYYVKLFDEPGDPALGERWFNEKGCVECHAVGDVGNASGPRLDAYAADIAPIALGQGLWNHGRAMQAQQSVLRGRVITFLGREIADIQAFIRRESRLRNRDPRFLHPPDPNAGRRLFRTKQCAQCHAATGRGTQWGPDLRAATERLRVSEIAGQLWNHSAAMASAMQARGIVFPEFRGSEMADLIAYLYYLRFDDQTGNVTVGERLFTEKGCAGCHRGGTAGPDLSESTAALTPLGLATAMWDHAPAMHERVQQTAMDWPRFEGDEMRDLSLYLRELASRGQQ